MANIHPFNRLLHYERKVVTHKFMSTAIVHKKWRHSINVRMKSKFMADQNT